MAVQIAYEPAFTASTPEQLFTGRFATFDAQVAAANYDVSPDGERFLMVQPAQRSTTINVVLS